MKAGELMQNILNDIKVELLDEFTENFRRKAFFSKPWDNRKQGRKGTLLMVSGALRRSIQARVQGNSIVFTSNVPYAGIHNEGGTITITPKMKKFFWAKYYETSGKVTYNIKTRKQSKSSQKYSMEAEFWKSLALKKTGDKLIFPQRQFIGDSPEVKHAIETVINDNIKDFETHLTDILKPKQ
jgi:phage gpG-like protein